MINSSFEIENLDELKKVICFKNSFAIYEILTFLIILFLLLVKKIINLRRPNVE